jgi:hypothetical protein
MNSNERTRYELEKHSGERNISKSIVRVSFLTLLGIAVVKTVKYLLRAADALPDTIPPIIIKSSSFIAETDEPFDVSGGTGGNPFIYKRVGFKEIKGVRVFLNNEKTGSAESYDYDDPRWVDVDIWFQEYINNSWQPATLPVNPDVTIRSELGSGADKDFVMRMRKQLDKKGKPNPKRKEKRRDNDNDTFRFARVRVRENTGGGDTFNYTEGDHFMIAFYNYLG